MGRTRKGDVVSTMNKRMARTLKVVGYVAVACVGVAVIYCAPIVWIMADDIAVGGYVYGANTVKLSAAGGGAVGIALTFIGLEGVYRTLARAITT